jgi:hypothetical protein
MDILEALEILKDYCLFEEQEWTVDKIIDNIKKEVYLKSGFTKDDYEYLMCRAKSIKPLIKVLFPEEYQEKSNKLDQIVNVIANYKEGLEIARKLI